MFAGPNGSGKSTIKAKVAEINPNVLGVYINPDDIEREIAASGRIDFTHFKIKTTEGLIFASLRNSTQLSDKGLLNELSKLTFDKNALSFTGVSLNSYFVSALADFLHERLIESRISFSFETVMSHPNKINLLDRSHTGGFRNYLYYVATEDPEINISRVKTRVLEGGHDVPTDKLVARYYRSLENLLDAVRATDRTYIFDNSGTESFLGRDHGRKKDRDQEFKRACMVQEIRTR
ncbi:MAG: zeta toxin family protein [Pyrinomonadaceae bacterium]